MRRTNPLLVLLVALGLSVLALACSRGLDPVSPAPDVSRDAAPSLAGAPQSGVPGDPQASAQSLFYPLELGNRWHYRAETRMTFIPTGQPPQESVVIEADIRRALVCIESLNSVDYTVERSTIDEGTQTYLQWVRFRQDRRGLYEADVSVIGPPPCDAQPGATMLTGRARMDDAPDAMSRALQARLAGADPATARAVLAAWGDLRERLYLMRDPTSSGLAAHGHGRKGGPLPGEITRLSYPLRTGARWVIRQDPLFTSVVEGVEPVAVAGHKIPAFRIRIESELAGANDRVHLWASRAGMVKLAYHLEGVAMDENGNVLGLLIAEHRERLLDLHLVAPGRDKDVAANQAE